MKITGQVRVKAPRAAVYEALRDARFFASCVEGVHDLAEIAPDRYEATLETKVAALPDEQHIEERVTAKVKAGLPPLPPPFDPTAAPSFRNSTSRQPQV